MTVRRQAVAGRALLFSDQTAVSTPWTPQPEHCGGKRESRRTKRRALTAVSFAVHGDLAFVPAASWEETRSIDPAYPCCTFRGSVTAVRIADGSVVWKTHLVEPPQRTGATSIGTPTFGPSGAGRLVRVRPSTSGVACSTWTTGDNYSHPRPSTSDAVVALDLATGHIVWAQHNAAERRLQLGVRGAAASNCPEGRSAPTTTSAPRRCWFASASGA